MRRWDWKLAVVVVLLSALFSLVVLTPPNFIARVISLSGGYVTQLSLPNQTGTITQWEGVRGNISNNPADTSVTVSGNAISTANMYSACPPDQTGDILFWQSGTIDTNSLVAGDVSALDTLLGLSASDALSATNLFTASTTFNINGTAITTSATSTQSPTGHSLGLLRETTLNIPVFVTTIQQDTALFDGAIGDFQVLLPYISADPSFDMQLDPGDICPGFCGDNTCGGNETDANCPSDCSYCGDSTCDANETIANCAIDCTTAFCGDFTCDGNETTSNCIIDCYTGFCGDISCGYNETLINCAGDCFTTFCGDGDCNATIAEDCSTCAADCGFCPEEFPEVEPEIPPGQDIGAIQVDPPAGQPIEPIGTTPGNVKKPEPKTQTFSSGFIDGALYVDPSEIAASVSQGGSRYFQIRILNTHQNSWLLSLDLRGEVFPYTALAQRTYFVGARSQTVVQLTFAADIETPLGTYEGSLVLIDQNNRERVTVPITLRVTEYEPGFVYDIQPTRRRVRAGEAAVIEFSISGVEDAEVTYGAELLDVSTQEPLSSVTFTSQVTGRKNGKFSLPIPDDILDLRYIIQGKAFYIENGVENTAEDTSFITVYALSTLYFLLIPLIGLLLLALGMTMGDTIKKIVPVGRHETAALVIDDDFSLEQPSLKRLANSDDSRNKILMVESKQRLLRLLEKEAKTLQYYEPKHLLPFIITLRECAKRLKGHSYDVHYYKSPTLMEAVTTFVTKYNIQRLYVTEPQDTELKRVLKNVASSVPQVEFVTWPDVN